MFLINFEVLSEKEICIIINGKFEKKKKRDPFEIIRINRHEEFHLLIYNAMQFSGSLSTFRKNNSPPSSRSRNKPCSRRISPAVR
jgi:hypothetical protein